MVSVSLPARSHGLPHRNCGSPLHYTSVFVRLVVVCLEVSTSQVLQWNIQDDIGGVRGLKDLERRGVVRPGLTSVYKGELDGVAIHSVVDARRCGEKIPSVSARQRRALSCYSPRWRR